MNPRHFLIALLLTLLAMHDAAAQADPIGAKVEALLARMTLAEKIGQMNQYNGFWDATGPAPQGGSAALKYEHLRKGMVGSMLNVRGAEQVRAVQKIAVEETRLGIPLIIGFDVIHGYKTLSPIPLAEAASWDLAAIERSARVAAIEASAAGIHWTFAPMVDISRDARWGRVMEGAGEDPWLGSLVAAARVRGFQGSDLSQPNTIAACAKHFAAYGFAEAGLDYNTVDIGVSTLYNIVLPPFRAAAQAGVRTFMNAFNELNGVPATGNAFLQRDILKTQWGFEGFVVSDWASISEMLTHGFARDGAHAAELAAKAGSDMDMESYFYIEHLERLVNEGKVDIGLIDDAVRRILRVKFELGLFDDPYRYCDPAREKALIGHPDHHAAVLDMAKKSIVLLKNEGGLLPLKKQGQKIALIGPLVKDKNSPLGSWRLASDDNSGVSLWEGMQARGGSGLLYAKGCDLYKGEVAFIQEVKVNMDDRSGFAEALKAAKQADVVVMALGEHAFQSGEARSRTRLDLPGLQQELLEAVYKVNPKVVLVLMNGRPLALPWAAEHVPAIVEAWQLGTQSGNAIAEVLYGDYNPSGKLPMSFPRSVGQVPIYYNHKSTGRPDPQPIVFWTHYSDESRQPLYPFGYGLSYTRFEYSDLAVAVKGRQVEVSVTLRNSGGRAGEEVAQLYLRDRVASVTRPVKELKAFQKVALAPGESRRLTFLLGEAELGFYNNQRQFVVEPGEFDVMVGGSSAEGLSQRFQIE
jgi:beta-glucosidase